MDTTYLDALIREKHIIACCGAGGVGKTTTAAAIGVAAALAGRRVLVLTIDPARRLAEAMGISHMGDHPIGVKLDELCGRPIEGKLDAWMLSPRVVLEQMVRRLADSEERAAQILSNRLYLTISELVSGMQEYTAAEALYTFSTDGKYDLVVLDTPPSRNALEFLEAPRKLALFLDEKIVGVFLPKSGSGGGLFWGRARQLVSMVFGKLFGEGFFEELQGFMGAFSGMFASMREHAESVRGLLSSERSSFVVVTSPNEAALDEAAYLHHRLVDSHLPFAGYILNRSWAYTRGLGSPEQIVLAHDAPQAAYDGLRKLVELADFERRLAARDRELLAKLRDEGRCAMATPNLGGALETFSGLVELATSMIVTTPEVLPQPAPSST